MAAVPTSMLREIVWPAVPTPAASRLFALMFQLEQTQWWSAEALRDQQLRQLDHLIAHATRTVPYYRTRLSGIAPLDTPLTAEAWRDIPMLARSDIQNAGDELKTEQLPPGHGEIHDSITSGSTGSPVRTCDTDLTVLYNQAFGLRRALWHGRDFSATTAVIRKFAAGEARPPNGARGLHWAPGYETGPQVLLDVSCSVEVQLAWLRRERPAYLMTFPSNLQMIADFCLAENEGLPGLRGISTFAETVDPALRETCQRAFGVPLVDSYTATDAGTIAIQSPHGHHYLVQSESVLLEVLDDAAQPVQPGNVGRVVVTVLHNYATPIIRFDIGDFAEVGAPDPGGRGLPVLSQILGRVHDLVTLPDGTRFFPQCYPVFRKTDAVRQYQVVQRSLKHIDVKLSTSRPFNRSDEDAIRRDMIAAFRHPFEINFTYVNEIPREASGKYFDFKSKLT